MISKLDLMMFTSKNKVGSHFYLTIGCEKKHQKFQTSQILPISHEISPRVFLEILSKIFLESDFWNHNQSKYL